PVVLAREQELRSFAVEVTLEVIDRAVDLCLELGVAGLLGQLEGSLEITGAGQQARPQLDVGAQAVRLAQHLLRGPAIVPEARLRGACLETGQSRLPGREVKDAPRSIGSAPPGRGRARRPPSSWGPAGPGAGSDGARSSAAPTCSGRRRGSRRDNSRCGGRPR